MYTKKVRIEFDLAKDRVNAAKHGVALAKAGELEWDWLLCRPDTRRDYRAEMKLSVDSDALVMPSSTSA